MLFIPGESSKIARRYSVQVEQRVLSKEAYDFWVALQKTTESLGGLFDPLPSQVIGNLWSNNPNAAEPVLGYFSGGSAPRQRIFIDFVDLPSNILSVYRPRYCGDEDVSPVFNAVLRSLLKSTLLIDPIYVQGVGVVGYTTADNACIDCRIFGGTTKRPDFW
jgi:hypothetical protein